MSAPQHPPVGEERSFPGRSPVSPADALSAKERTEAAARLLPAPGTTQVLNRLAELARRLLCAVSAQISLLTDVQTVAGGAGIPAHYVGSSGPLDESLCTVTAASGSALVIPDAVADERVAHLPPVRTGAIGAYLGVPLTTATGQLIGALCVFDPTRRPWLLSEQLLLEQLASWVMTELELAALTAEYDASRVRWEVALEAAGIGSFDWDLRTDRVEWDERLQELLGYRPGEFVPRTGEAFRRVHPEDQDAVSAAIARAVHTCGDYRAEFRVILPSGAQRWLAARGRAHPGPDGTATELVGTVHDITDAREAQNWAVHLLETMATGFLSVDRSWRVTYLNHAGEQMIGKTVAQVWGRLLWEVFPGDADQDIEQECRRAVASETSVRFDVFYADLNTWLEVRAVPEQGSLALYFLDISDRRAAAQQSAATAARLGLLAAVSAELAATLEVEPAMARLAQLVVPELADWCIVTLVDEEHPARDVGYWHVDADRLPVVRRYAELHLGALSENSYVAEVLRTGNPVQLAAGAHAAIRGMLLSGEAREAFDSLAPESVAVLPLRARGRTVGLLTLFRGAGRPGLVDPDLVIAREVAARAGLALDNARLYSQQRSLAEGLQRSLLTEPPQPAGCQIEARYVPAGEIASVGGDWFDSFEQGAGVTTLVIGDVVGHDTEAAAAMGQLRGLLRGVAWQSGAGPAEVLTGLDAAMEGLQVHTFATAVVARLENPAAGTGVRPADIRLRWSNAGHPPPMVIASDGQVIVLSGAAGGGADLLLGIDPRTPRTEFTLTLTPGATVLLYTDGLVERRGQNLDEGIELLRHALTECAELPLADLCDRVLARLLLDHPDDDVAMIALRLTR